MSLKIFDKNFADQLQKAVGAIEKKTAAEVVVVISPESGDYRDTYWKGGAVYSFLLMLFLLYAPFYFSEWLVPLVMLVNFVLGAALIKYIPPLKRLLLSRKRMNLRVRREAYAYFLENQLNETRGRTALLIYISLLEERCFFLADKGIEAVVPLGDFKEVELEFQKIFTQKTPLPQAILDKLPTMTPLLAQYLPAAADDIDEIPNQMRKVGE